MTETTEMTKLLNSHKAPTKFYNEVHQQVSDVASYMEPGVLYTTQMLCGDQYWNALPSDWWRRLAGRCLAHMVSTKQFPFSFVQYKRSPTKRYRLID
jgi:hypothetical protein